MNDLPISKVVRVSRVLCLSGKFETGQGTCSLLCLDQLGDARKIPCRRVTVVHGELAAKIVRELEESK